MHGQQLSGAPPEKRSSPDLRYPIGRYHPPHEIDSEQRSAWITIIASLPQKLRAVVCSLTEAQLDTPYRPGGWTVRQVVHHLPDSHLNSYCRLRLALTEKSPLIKPYNEAAWAELADAKTGPLEPSLALLDGLHARWVTLWRSMREPDYSRTFTHPELGEVRLDWNLGLYAWHCQHHLAHITNLKAREGWPD